MTTELRILGISFPEEVREGDNLADILGGHLGRKGLTWEEGDVLVVAQKAVSKAEGRVVRLDDVKPSPSTLEWAERYGRDARVVELALKESSRVVRMERGVLVTRTRHGFVCANSGVDRSNAPDGTAILLPCDPDGSAASIRRRVRDRFQVRIACLVSDSFGRPWRLGQLGTAIGVSGIRPLIKSDGRVDRSGRPLQATAEAVADELAAAAGLVMGKASGTPAALIRGYLYEPRESTIAELLRDREEDLFS